MAILFGRVGVATISVVAALVVVVSPLVLLEGVPAQQAVAAVVLALALALGLMAHRAAVGARHLDGVCALTSSVRAVSQDDYSIRVAEEGPPEIRALAAALNGLIAQVETRVHERERAEQERARGQELERERLQEQLRQAHKMEAVGRLAGGVAHDFNNLLGVITGYAEILEREGDASTAPKVEQILRASERAAGLTRQLLAFSRRQILDPKVLDLSSLVRDMEKMLQRLIGEDVRLQVAAPSRLGSVRADPGQLEQVLMNLAVNARDAMPEGGTIRVAVDAVVLGPGDSRDVPAGRYVRLSVQDSGAGIAAEAMPHIFEPFFTTKEKGKGTGLGLATVYGIVQQSGGAIEVASELGRGTTFRIHLPQLDEAPSARREAGPSEPAAGTGTVLVVEDDDTLRSLIATMLRDSGYTVLEAPAGPQALALAEHHPASIDVVLTDVVMPGLNGRQVGEMLTTRRTDVGVIYMSGYTEEVLERNGVLEGGVVLHKPFNTTALLEAVRHAMGARRTAEPPAPQPLLAASWPHRRAWHGASSVA